MHSNAQRIAGPVHDLAEVQQLVRENPNFGLAVQKGTRAIMEQRRCTSREARAFARDAVLSLTQSNYAEAIRYQDGEEMDVYGKTIEEQGWYIKVSIQRDPRGAYIHSCHLAMQPIHTQGGTVPRAQRW